MRLPVLIAALALLASAAAANGFRILEGHGGPIHDAAFSGDLAATASFDNSVGLWREAAGEPVWLDGHEAAVKTVVFVGEGRIASAGDDQQIIIWDVESGSPVHRLTGHKGPILSLAVSQNGGMIASASWDKRIGIWDVETGALVRWLEGHTGLVNDVAFGAEGALFSASYDGTIREWRVADGVITRTLVRHGFGVNTLLLNEADGWLAYGALDGGTRAISLADNAELADLTLDRRPILAMAMRADGDQIAVGDGEGYIMIVSSEDWSIAHDFRAAKRGPIWALAYVDNGAAVVAGGIEDAAYVFPLEDTQTQPRMGQSPRAFHTDPSEVENGERQFLRKCSICHTLTADSARKAGPSLHRLFGRRAGTYPGYEYSDALMGSDLIWSKTSVDKLFELGPDHYTPGSKMPMQQIARPQDRADLIEFLVKATAD